MPVHVAADSTRHRFARRCAGILFIALAGAAAVSLAGCAPDGSTARPAALPGTDSSPVSDGYPAAQATTSIPTPAADTTGYPPPREPTPTAIPTAAVGLDGYRDMPRDVDSRVVMLDTAPQADVVHRFQELLDAGDANALAGWISDNRYQLMMAPVGRYMEAGHNTQSTEAATILQRLFEAGSKPRIEGYHVHGSATVPCLSIVTSGWRGDVTIALPTAEAQSEMGPGPSEITVPGGEQRWDMCVTQSGEPIWKGWWWGGYGDLIADIDSNVYSIADITEQQPYLVVRPPDSITPVTSADLGITLDVPAGWVVEDDGTMILQSFHSTIGHGGMPDDRTKIDVRRRSDNPDVGNAAASPGATPQAANLLTLGPHGYPAERIDITDEFGASSILRITIGDAVYEFNCGGDCTALERIAASIRSAEAAP